MLAKHICIALHPPLNKRGDNMAKYESFYSYTRMLKHTTPCFTAFTALGPILYFPPSLNQLHCTGFIHLSELTIHHCLTLSVHSMFAVILTNLTYTDWPRTCSVFCLRTILMEVWLLLVKLKYRHRQITHALFVQFKELLGDFGCAERQPQKGYIELRDDLLQDLFEWQTTNRSMSPCRRHCIL